jgi:5-formyltetrahydrofolate cyclo-ligase
MAGRTGCRSKENQKVIVDLNKQKTEMRELTRAALKKVSVAARTQASLKLCGKLKEQSFFQNAISVLFFAPLPDEVNVWPLLEETLAKGKIVALPRFDSERKHYTAHRIQNLETQIMTGPFNVREPKLECLKIPFADFDLVLVPGIAFDLRGNRLGRGMGFYDRLLVDVRGIKIGIALDEQIAGEVPAGKTDIKMDFILTPTRCVKISD